jgi:hypothetical protein
MGIGRFVAIAAASLFVYSTVLRAECWTPPPPCEALTRNSVVVLAEVLDARYPSVENRPNEFARLDMRLRVLERFKGVADKQAEIEASIPMTAESIMPLKGATYLIFADLTRSGNWQTACGRTRQVSADDDEVRILRQCRSDLEKGKR